MGRDDRLGPLRQGARLAVLSPHARSLPHLAAFLPDLRLTGPTSAFSADAWAIWGANRYSGPVRRTAALLGYELIRLEDGFLRSVGLGKDGVLPMSIVWDDRGIYYDARSECRFERLLHSIDPTWEELGAAIGARIVASRLSKYNSQPDRPVSLGPRDRRRLLIVDQVRNDFSISGALADRETFGRMIAVARSENPQAEILVRRHPDVVAGHRQGHFGDEIGGAGARFLDEAVDVHAILDAVDEVWTVSSQTGFDALVRGLPVTTFGVPFYAGWGLTRDRAEGPAAMRAFARRRGPTPSVNELIAAALAVYPLYVDLDGGHRIDVFEAIERLAARRDAMSRTKID